MLLNFTAFFGCVTDLNQLGVSYFPLQHRYPEKWTMPSPESPTTRTTMESVSVIPGILFPNSLNS
ncbi:MAG: hypothetical protein BMS9Abin30_0627 [Gammaproteobacteria bacterium]|nr:MAG: hypothetical protein BMS9Abin30_0627 [Gammaproteobacteria bacterium]